nr:reverse transcriptase domain-containing protein [Tanacetum cinerariifolium]
DFQADRAQSPRVPVPFPEDPYEAIRQASSPTSLPDNTPPTRHAEELEDSDMSGPHVMAVRVPPVMSPCLSANIAKVAAMYDLTFRKSKGLEEDDEEEDEEDEDEKVEESSDSDSESKDAKDEGPTAEDEGPTAGDKGLAAGDEGPGIRVESLGLGGDEAVPEGQHRVASVMETAVGKPLGLGYGALRRREIASREGQIPYVFEVVKVLDLYQSLRDQRECKGLMLIDPEDSQLLVNQIKGIYAAKQPTIREYLQRTKEILRRFKSYTIEHVRRNQNKKANALRKLALMTFEHLTKEVLVEVLARRSIEEKEEIRTKAPQYKLTRGSLYKKSFYTPWLRSIASPKTYDVIKEIHEGSYSFNTEPRSMVVRITKQGYYWPSMHRDVSRIIQDYEKCQDQSAVRKRAKIR